MTIGSGVDRVVNGTIVGLGRAAHRVLNLRPAKVESDLRAYLAMRAVSDEAALVEAEAQEEVWEPGQLSGLYPSGQPTDQPEPCPACDYTDNGWCPCACHPPPLSSSRL